MESTDFISGRTSGDGMEFVEPARSDTSRATKATQHLSADISSSKGAINRSENIPGANVIYRRDDEASKSAKLPVKMPQGKQFYLIPHLVATKKSFSLKSKEPKFVPFEPYKAAVNPMMPPKSKAKKRPQHKNQLDLNTLVSHVASMSTSEFSNMNLSTQSIMPDDADKVERLAWERKLADMKKDRDSFESQLKFQVQVNTELKNLLVAAVGEDLQTHVNVLTEDKLQLARALLSSAHNITSHTEQIEFLANQCEVWRSKFLASTLMVEELAKWKANLLQKNKLLLESNKQQLETMSQLRIMQSNVLCNLKSLAQVDSLNMLSGNVVDLTHKSLNLSDQLVLISGIERPSNLDLANLDTTTAAEKFAIEAIQYANQKLISCDAATKAVVEQAFPTVKQSRETQTDNSTQ